MKPQQLQNCVVQKLHRPQAGKLISRLSVCVCVCVCVCVYGCARAVCSRLCCMAQPYRPDRLLLLPSIEVSTASFCRIPAQLAIFGATTSENMCTYIHKSDDTGTKHILHIHRMKQGEANVPPELAPITRSTTFLLPLFRCYLPCCSWASALCLLVSTGTLQ